MTETTLRVMNVFPAGCFVRENELYNRRAGEASLSDVWRNSFAKQVRPLAVN